nr:hypothetical protein GCM10010200_073070 [Actinomadura rugatobispora]
MTDGVRGGWDRPGCACCRGWDRCFDRELCLDRGRPGSAQKASYELSDACLLSRRAMPSPVEEAKAANDAEVPSRSGPRGSGTRS